MVICCAFLEGRVVCFVALSLPAQCAQLDGEPVGLFRCRVNQTIIHCCTAYFPSLSCTLSCFSDSVGNLLYLRKAVIPPLAGAAKRLPEVTGGFRRASCIDDL